MERRIPPPGSYFHHTPIGVPVPPPLHRPSPISDRQRYLADLLAERQKLDPFLQILPGCSRLLNQEIMKVSSSIASQVTELERMGHDLPLPPLHPHPNGRPMNIGAWHPMQTEDEKLIHKMSPLQPPLNWPASPGMVNNPIVKRVIRLDVPVEKYPDYNFVGRILGPRGNSLKRVEMLTECRIYIRGQGSVKDAVKEETLKDKPGYEHLKEPLHILVEAEFPEDIMDARLDHAIVILESLLKPVDESMDTYKKQQLRELAIINGTFREESPSMSPGMSPSMSPFSSTGMKRAKTGR